MLPPGARLLREWVREREERELVDRIAAQPWNESLKRRTQHYGYEYAYERRSVGEAIGPLPAWLDVVVEGLLRDGIGSRRAEQAIVNEYPPGTGIRAHTDAAIFDEPIASLSLGSDTVMTFSLDGSARDRVDVVLPRRSLLVLEGEARWRWKHEIAARKSDAGRPRSLRYSVTFRWLRAREANAHTQA